ncbi:hypothetical protein ABT115_30065 [Streptomyces sp. NPDC001832]
MRKLTGSSPNSGTTCAGRIKLDVPAGDHKIDLVTANGSITGRNG